MTRNNILVAFILVFSILLTSFGFYIYQIVYTPNLQIDREGVFIYIPRGMTYKELQNELYQSGIVNDMVSFSFLARLLDYDTNVKPGRYYIESNTTNIVAIRYLRSGAQVPTRITFNTIRTFDDLAEKITANIALTKEEFLEVVLDKEVQSKYGFDEYSFIGMFIPNTYEVFWTIKADELVEKMYQEYRRFWNQDRMNKADKMGLTSKEVVVLASIVNAETTKADERSKVAGVYVNRLKKRMLLQADPTLVFAIGDFSINRVLDIHKQIDSPYNTYRYLGLPPGPINLPEVNVIDATLNYEDHNYLYFCAKSDFSGYHAFATNLVDHLRNAQAYQAALNKAKVYR
jgi:UPF0755 protein